MIGKTSMQANVNRRGSEAERHMGYEQHVTGIETLPFLSKDIYKGVTVGYEKHIA